MRLMIRFALPLVVVLAVLAAAFTPVADILIGRWFQHDVEMRSRLVFSSVRDTLAELIRGGSRREVVTLFNRIAEDERVLAVAWCTSAGQLREASRQWPGEVSCPPVTKDGGPLFETATPARGSVLTAAFPLEVDGAVLGRLLILHDMSFAASRGLAARLYMMGFLVLLGIAAAGVTILTARLTLRGWVRGLRRSLRGGRRPIAQRRSPHGAGGFRNSLVVARS